MHSINQNTYSVEIIQKTNNPIYEQRESSLTHSPFHLEIILYTAIKLGNETEVTKAINQYIHHGIVIGRLSLRVIKKRIRIYSKKLS